MVELPHKERIEISLGEADIALTCLREQGIVNETLPFQSLEPLILAVEQMIRMTETKEFREIGEDLQRQFFIDYMALLRIIKSQNKVIAALK